MDVSWLMSGMVGATSGNFHTCGITTWWGAKCWGYNAYGQLGDGTTNNSSTPVDVSWLSSGVIGITTGDFHTCGITSSWGIKCWGDNLSGQLGDGTTSTGATTTPVSVLSSVWGSPINIFTAQTRETSCGTQPANTSINTPSSKLTFTQNSTDGGTTWVPTSKSWTYSGTIGECNYSCVNGYSWNGSSCVLSWTGILSSPTWTGILSSPTIVSPTGTINTNTPIYSWSGGSWAIRVEIQTVVGTLIASGASTSTGYSLTPVLALSEGLNTFLVTGYDSLGMSGTTVTGTVIVDSIAPANPIILSHGSGAVVQSQSFTLTGTAESGSTVKVTVSSGNIYSGLADTAWNWSILVNFPLGIVYPIFTATDTIGNMSTGVTLTMTVTNSGSTTLVSTPFVTSHTSGMSTAISAVTLSGTATVWNIVNIYSWTVLLSSAQANIYGIWATTVNLISGQNTLTLYATDTLGNRSYSIGLTLYFTGLVSFSGITITSPISSGTYSYSNIVANGKWTPGNTLVVSTPSGTISGLIDATGSWSVQITLVTWTNTLTFYERTPAGILSSGLSLTVTYNQGGGGTINPSTYNITPIGSYIPSKNDLSVVDHSRLDQLPSDSVCALDEHVKLNRIITTDITGIWAEGYVRTLIRFWVIKNTENFYPNKSITRGEFLALVVRSLRCNYAVDELDAASTTSFSDVPEGHFANKYLAIAEQHGWLPSNISTRFRPDIFITRAEAIDIVRWATGLSDATGVDGFSDISRLSADIQDAILTAEKYDIVHGIQRLANWYFYPNNPLTRAEAAKIIQRTFVR